jgi:hypothetical protein
MSYHRGQPYPPRKRARGGIFPGEDADVDYNDAGDRYSRPRISAEESMLTRLRKDFISLAVRISFCFLMLEPQSSVYDC